MAAAASSLKHLASDQVQAVSVFKLPDSSAKGLLSYRQ